MKLKEVTLIESGKPKKARVKALYRDANGNLVATHKLSQTDKKKLEINPVEQQEKNKELVAYVAIIVIGILGIAGMYLFN